MKKCKVTQATPVLQAGETQCEHLEDLPLMGCNATTNKQEETPENQEHSMRKPGVCMKVETA